ncbi:hypothetical protein BJX61DRAFT_546554 [Aspergillus egyptiacus]|nr:hypothetical protein BJX61DRAFT_546554 [Aspergillus egyptiacus]
MPTPSTNESTRRDLLTRHGLVVSDENPNHITIIVDVPCNSDPDEGKKTGKEDKEEEEEIPPYTWAWYNRLYTRLIGWMLHEVQCRLCRQEFCNPFGPPKADYGRIALTVDTDAPTPNTVFKDVERVLLDFAGRIEEAVQDGVELDFDRTMEELGLVFEWMSGGQRGGRFYEGIRAVEWRGRSVRWVE